MSRLQYPSSYYHSIDFSSSLDKDSAFEICKCHFKKAVGDLGTYPNVNVKLRRRHSDPGPKLAGFLENHLPAECNADGRAPEFQDLTNRYNEDVPTIQRKYHIIFSCLDCVLIFCFETDEIEKDETLSNLLQEIRNLRQINRKLSVELFHSKMLLQIAEQTNNYSSEPGSASGKNDLSFHTISALSSHTISAFAVLATS